METPVKHTASELRAMLKEHKKSTPRLSAKKNELMEYAGKIGLLKSASVPLPPSPPPEAAPKKMELPVVLKKAAPAVPAAPKKAELPAALKKPEAKASKKPEAAPAPVKKAFSEGAKAALGAYTSFIADKKARGMSHAEALAAWKNK